MTFKPRIWYPIAAVLTLINVASVWPAAVAAEGPHATLHGALAVVCGLWAYRLRQRRGEETQEALPPGMETMGLEVDDLRQALAETQERLDFAERVLAQQGRMDPTERERS